MKTPEDILQNPETDQEFQPGSGHAKMPVVLLLLWVANITFFFAYFIKYGWADLQQWIAK